MEVSLKISKRYDLDDACDDTWHIEGDINITEEEVELIVNKYISIATERGIETAKRMIEEFGIEGE